MTSPATAIDSYFQAISELQKRVMDDQRTTLLEIAEKVAGAAEQNQVLLEKWRPLNIHL